MKIKDLLSEERAAVPPKPRNFVAKNAKMGGAGQHTDKKKAAKQGDVKHKKELATMEDTLGELSTDKLAQYKKAAGADAKRADADGDYARGDKRFKGINKATNKQFDNDLKKHGQQGVAEVSLGDYRKKATMQKAKSQMGAMFNNDPEKQKQHQATFDKRERGLDRLKARDDLARKTTADKQMADNIAKLPELKAEYERMKAEYTSLGGSNWQYADREQNLTDRERKARSMEGPMNNLWRTISAAEKAQKSEGVAEGWSQKYKSSINCSHPRGFSQKAHCAGKKKHNESVETELVCEDCGMCQTHGSLNEIAKVAKDSNGYTKCWPGKHAEGTKKGKNGGQVRNCVPNESQGVAEGAMSELAIEIGDMLDGYIAKYQDGLLDADHLGAMIDKVAARLSQQHNTDQNEMARHVSNYVADAVGEE